MLVSSLVLSTVFGIRSWCRRLSAVAKDAKRKPLPAILSNQSDCFIAFNKEAVSQTAAS